jgi:F0F1-type ATP synthase assembly protein I
MGDDDQRQRSDLEQFGDRLAKAKGEARSFDPHGGEARSSAAGDGMRVAIEFVVSVLFGSGLGFTIGSLLGSPVVGLLIGLPFGFAAGLRTVYRGLVLQNEAAADERNERGGND